MRGSGGERCGAVQAAGRISAETASATWAESGAVPQGLVGRWIRNVTTADLLRLPNSYASPGVYLFRIGKSGQFDLWYPWPRPIVHRGPGYVRPLPNGRMILELDCPVKGIYRWKLSVSRLTLTLVKDECLHQAPVLWGVWKRVKP